MVPYFLRADFVLCDKKAFLGTVGVSVRATVAVFDLDRTFARNDHLGSHVFL